LSGQKRPRHERQVWESSRHEVERALDAVTADLVKAERLTAARVALAMPAPNPRAVEDGQAFMRRVAAIDIDRCPHCHAGRWSIVETRRLTALA
jgi:hypothetical protein